MCTDKDYITITENGYFINSQPTNYYRSELIYLPKKYTSFAFTNSLHNRGIQEIHALTSETLGIYLNTGNPSGQHGQNIWCRVKLIDGTIGDWTFFAKAENTKIAAICCIQGCLDNIWCGKLGKVMIATLKNQTAKIRN